jgi:ssDNA-binding Zn-finger/Zn-ribbon topoisomerase 1
MAEDNKQSQELDIVFVRDQLDDILAQEITALLDVDAGSAMMSFNLASISCITLIVEREREIKQFSDSPPERYTAESFLKELIEIGLEKDGHLDKTFDLVLSKGYLRQDEKGQLHPEMPAFMMVGFLDTMFPGMPGMNLVAFVLQMNEEVNSGRKTLVLAKESFKSTLKSRGVSVSKDRAEKKATEIKSGTTAVSSQSREISQKLKKENLDRLSSLIRNRKRRSMEPSARFKVKDVFDKGPSIEDQKIQAAENKKVEEAAKKAAELAAQLAEKEAEIKQAEAAAKDAARHLAEIEIKEKQLLAAREEAKKVAEKASDLAAREALMAQKEAQLKALEQRLEQEAEKKLHQAEAATQKEIQDVQDKKNSQVDADIESRIAALESELTMPCPLCKEGEVISKTTEKGKVFFSCTRSGCRFVAWDKPYHFECPLCKNSFLTETTAPTGEKGLKCPRASCAYSQNSLLDPKLDMAQASASAAVKKKKRLVRRKKH